MSGFLTPVGFGGQLYNGSLARLTDETCLPRYASWQGCGGLQQQSPWEDGFLWPNSRLAGSDANGNIFGMDIATTCQFGIDDGFESSGGQQFRKIVGTCRDSVGAVLGSCVIQGFLTATDTFVSQVTCDSAGYFEFCTQYTGTHYLTAYKAGSPDVAGTTVNTLVGV